jgi:hypothetical protein
MEILSNSKLHYYFFYLCLQNINMISLFLVYCIAYTIAHGNIGRSGEFSNNQLGFPPKLISSEFRSEFRSKLVLTFDKIIGQNLSKLIGISISNVGIEIPTSNQN